MWTWDFIFDRTRHGRSLKWFSVVDEYTRECLALEVERRMTANDVIDVLADLFTIRGAPKHIRSDNGPEFIARAIRRHLAVMEIGPLYIEPGAPWENGYAESFQGKLRDELLNAEEFENLVEAKTLAAAWQADYNHRRPHSSLGYLVVDEGRRQNVEIAVAVHVGHEHALGADDAGHGLNSPFLAQL